MHPNPAGRWTMGAKSDANETTTVASPPGVLDPEPAWNPRRRLRGGICSTAVMHPRHAAGLYPHVCDIVFALLTCKST
uniref:Uncharacterized protein n=1 Tax=Aegilops tauschii subsp. strangulata TaxID=200361 RepID=A0A453LX51_AEGTS